MPGQGGGIRPHSPLARAQPCGSDAAAASRAEHGEPNTGPGREAAELDLFKYGRFSQSRYTVSLLFIDLLIESDLVNQQIPKHFSKYAKFIS